MAVSGRWFIPLFLMNSLLIGAQTVQSPIPSALKASASGAEITLSWQDAPDVTGESYEIRSSLSPFTSGIPGDTIILSRIPEGREYYSFIPPDSEPRYYAVTLVRGGERFLRLEAGVNTLTKPVLADRQLVEEARAVRVTGFKARRLEQGAEIRFTIAAGGREIGIFRSTLPFKSPSDFNMTTHILSVRPASESVVLVDRQNDGIPWFYAAADIRLVRTGSARVMDFAGIQESPVMVPYLDTTPRFSRETPLPPLRNSENPLAQTGADRSPLQEYLDAAPDFSGSIRVPKPVLLPGAGEDLQFIYRELVLAGDWQMAEQSLMPMVLSRELSLEARDAALFLLSQVLWQQMRHDEAFMYLLLLYPDTKVFPYGGDGEKWIRLIARPYLSP